jgi:hypothetical protein
MYNRKKKPTVAPKTPKILLFDLIVSSATSDIKMRVTESVEFAIGA